MSFQLTIDLDLPGGLDEALRTELTAKAKVEVAIGLYEARKLSSTYAAHYAGMSRPEFLDLLSERKIPLVHYADGEIEEQARLAERLGEEARNRILCKQ
jgi:predicted HTH domain antitoxin